MERLDTILGQLAVAECSSRAGPPSKRPDDVVIVSAVLFADSVSAIRTAIGKAKRGSLRETRAEDMLRPVLKHLVDSTGVDAGRIGDVVIGTVLPQSGKGATEVRIAALLAGLPEHVPVSTVNRQCSSGLQAIANVAAAISAGQYDVGIGGGVETSNGPNPEALAHPLAASCYLSMGETSENVAARYGITREQQDAMAARSQQRAAAARESGRFRDEILPIQVRFTDPKSGAAVEKLLKDDEGIRPGTTAEKLAKLPPAFRKDGSTTAGNASQLSDGAAAALVMRRDVAEAAGMPILGCLRSYAAVGCDPAVMGIGPAVAIPAALEKAGITANDVDLFEINEAFASQATYCVEKLGLDASIVNVNGGAIALGHPLGCTGARMTATLLHEMKRRGSTYGVVSMCIGSGMGAAAVYSRE